MADPRIPRNARRAALRRMTLAGVLTAAAFFLSYLEAILPFSVGIPGVKLGLCHIAVVFALYRLSVWETAAITAVRVILSALLFGSVASLAYSVAGAVLSLVVMLVLRRIRVRGKEAFSPLGVSVAGGVAHNLGQMLAAACLMQTAALALYLPVLLVAGACTGALVGLVGGILVSRVRV